MESVIFKDEACELTEDFIDIGYMAENFEATNFYNKSVEIKRSHPDKSMTILISFPKVTSDFVKEILTIDKLLSALEVPVHCYLIFDKETEERAALKNRLEKLQLIYDTEDEYGSMYGTKIVSGSLKDKLTKALFLISKDGSVFYLDMPNILEEPLNLERLRIELNKAYVTYTGVGCHG